MTQVPRSRHYRRNVLTVFASIFSLVTGLLVAVTLNASTASTANAASCGTTNLALNQPTTASSEQSASFPAPDATDGNTGTRWSSAFSDPQWLEVDLGSTQSICQVTLDWETAYATAFQIQVSNDNSTWTTIYSTTTGTGGDQTLSVTGSGRYIRMYGTTRATQYGYSLWEFQVFGTGSSACGTTNVALNQPTTASSEQSASFPPQDATDGNLNTRWSSAFSDPQWLEVDLGSVQSICQVVLDWETAYATAFQIQVSSDNSTWTTIYSTTTGTGGVEPVSVSGSGRYIRMNGTTRATQYGYSLWEFQVYTTGSGASPSPSPSPTPTPTGTGSGGSGAPPMSFWGNTGAIPAAQNVLEFSIVNQTNGQYPDSEVYWSFNGQTESIAQQPYIDMPANSAGRMYFYLGSPNSQYFDFIEFTVGASSINLDTTRVDRFGLKLAILLHGHDGSNQEIGENYATFQESRTATFQRFENAVPTEFKELATDDAPYGIPSPGNDAAFQAGGAYANYFSSYAAANGDSSDSTAQIFGCGGTLAANPPLCAGLNRHVAQLPTSEQSNPANFYLAAPANYYAWFWHQNAINGLQYGFPYDDDAGQSSDISVANPQYAVVAVGW
jgi:hypothetical protein